MQSFSRYVLLALLAAGCAAPGDAVEAYRSPILGGTAGSVGQYPTVVAIANRGLCTGTLVAPNLILTAAHCISPSVLGYSSQSQVTADTTVVLDTTYVYGSSGRAIAAAETIPHPSFNINALGDNDIGLIRLAETVTDRTPSPINRVASDAPAGVSTTLVGYGLTDPYNDNSAGRLNVLTNKLSVSCSNLGASNANLLCFNQSDGKGSCSGDSGGPAFVSIGGSQKVAGITSFGDEHCQQYGAYTRTDAELSFLDSNAPELACVSDGYCVAQCGTGGLPADPDCTACVADGECVAECGSGGLPDDPDCPNCDANGTCVPECGTGGLPVDPDCPVCVYDEDCGNPDLECDDGACVPIPFTPGGIGDTCDDTGDCVSGVCLEGPDGKRCSDFCDPMAANCPPGFDCLPAGDTGACFPGAGAGGDPAFGALSGGCGVNGGGSSLGALPVCALFLLLASARRRRRRQPRPVPNHDRARTHRCRF